MSQSILTPASRGAGIQTSAKTFWKQVLPETQIEYTTKTGKRATANFDKKYLQSLIDAFKGPLSATSFLLADDNNRHNMDPERVRATVSDMCLASELPPGVDGSGGGLFAKIKFPSAKEARAVMTNPQLGVSARIREGIPLHDGTVLERGIIHVLGTLDPQVKGMSPWQEVDLSIEDDDDLIDLSNQTYGKGNSVDPKKAKDANKIAIKDRDVTSFTEDEINGFSETELDEFLAAFADGDGIVPDDEPSGGTPDDNSDADATRQPVGAGADLSNTDKNTIDLANAQVAEANSRASEALRRVADAEWRATRADYLAKGVPPHILDLAEPVLNRPDDMIIDLSNDGGDDVNVAEIVRGLIEATEGTIDLSAEAGHSGSFTAGDGTDPDAATLDAWEAQFPSGKK